MLSLNRFGCLEVIHYVSGIFTIITEVSFFFIIIVMVIFVIFWKFDIHRCEGGCGEANLILSERGKWHNRPFSQVRLIAAYIN